MPESAVEMQLAAILGQHLRELRKAKGLSQERVALAAGISTNYYQLLEAGLRTRTPRTPANPSLMVLVALGEVLETPLPVILDEVLIRNAS
ncbi:helix-turn-helix domain-containing protein [Nocardia sp. NPDC058640]|uniref:helix-turn-helix domain-containing protein n=1 Tax=Nocardia sp. NPDC058640 TaxID=3346571 RepID=UPI0036634712